MKLPSDVVAMIGVRQYEETAEFPVERGYIWNTCAAVQNGNPLYWRSKPSSCIRLFMNAISSSTATDISGCAFSTSAMGWSIPSSPFPVG